MRLRRHSSKNTGLERVVRLRRHSSKNRILFMLKDNPDNAKIDSMILNNAWTNRIMFIFKDNPYNFDCESR